MVLAFTPTAVPTFVTLPDETLVQCPPVFPVIVVSVIDSSMGVAAGSAASSAKDAARSVPAMRTAPLALASAPAPLRRRRAKSPVECERVGQGRTC